MTTTTTGFRPVFACWGDSDIGTEYAAGANAVPNALTGETPTGVSATWTPGNSTGATVMTLSDGRVGPAVDPQTNKAFITGTLTLSDTAGTLSNTAFAFDARYRDAGRNGSGLYISGGTRAPRACSRWFGYSLSYGSVTLSKFIHNGFIVPMLIDDQNTARVFPLPQFSDGGWHRVAVFPEGETGFFSIAVDGQTVADRMSLRGGAHSAMTALPQVFIYTLAVTPVSSEATNAPWMEIAGAVRYRRMEMGVSAPTVTATADIGAGSATLTATVKL